MKRMVFRSGMTGREVSGGRCEGVCFPTASQAGEMFREVSRGVTNLPQDQRRDESSPPQHAGLTGNTSRRVGNDVAVKPLMHRKVAAPFAEFPSVETGTATVAEVKIEIFSQRLGVTVFDVGFAHEMDPPAADPPAIAEIPVLGPRPRKIHIKSAHLQEMPPGTGEVVAGQKVGIADVAVVVLVDDVDDQLAGRAVEIFGKAVPRGRANQGVGVLVECAGQGIEPTRTRKTIVVGEGEEFPGRGFRTAISRRRRPRIVLPDYVQLQPAAPARLVEHQRFGTSIVDHDNLEIGETTSRLQGQSIETLLHPRQSVVSGDDDRKFKLMRCGVEHELKCSS
jgi:hypothetical protein